MTDSRFSPPDPRLFPPDPTLTAPAEAKFRNKPKLRLHWLQAIAYVVLIITCLVHLMFIYDAYQILDAFQNYLENVARIFRTS
jgi:hypothetical protein